MAGHRRRRLRSDGLVTTRRSSFDGRDSYYRVDLVRCRELFAETGAALHPALRLVAPPQPGPTRSAPAAGRSPCTPRRSAR